ncbi:Dynamin N-terminal domain-containing protein [Madurella fahalii]|uniref:Dynamin N-terminal domain-containing protein n=1 Tax=Madurella fahalii TaxID=1157608 RepID=A0ABQ0G3H7_9PEZI
MSGASRPHTPTFRFGESGNDSHSFTFADGWIDASARRGSSADLGQHLSPPGTIERRTPQARLPSPDNRSDDPSSPTFDVGELRDVLPATEPRSSSTSPASSARPGPKLLSAQTNEGLQSIVPRSVRSRNGSETGSSPPAVYVFGQPQPVEFTFRSLHNATPLPSRQPSPQPSTPGAVTNRTGHGSPQSSGIAVPQLSLPSPAPSDLTTEASATVRGALPRNRTSDVSILSETDDHVTAYDVRDEKAPTHRFFTTEFQSTLQAGLGIARATSAEVRRLGSLVGSEGDLKKLLDDAQELCAFQGSDTKTIAVLGDSGEGKSSLINSLLHLPGIAKTGDIGSACTSVVTEYRQKRPDHSALIAIEVEHLSAAAIEEVIKELLWSYRQLYLPGVEGEGTSAEDYARYQRESGQAWSALEAAFKHKLGFGERMLQDMSEGALERITAQLIQWSHELEWPGGGINGLWQSTANSAEECAEKTAIFMQDKYWPFTKLIRIYLNAQVLKTGVILADLPGLQDTNLARVRATHDYLLKCNHIFIVAKISRAITDQSLRSSLFAVLSRHVPLEWEESAAKSLKIAVVCTKTEDIDTEAAAREFCGAGKPIPASHIEDLEAQIADAKATGNRILKKALKQRRDLLLINARNAHVTSGLQRAYAAKVPAGRLDVFCVSNKHYAKYSRKGDAELVRASGIPALRQFCYSITADAQLREARHFLQAKLFSLVNSVGLWIDGRLRRIRGKHAFDMGDGRKLLQVVDGMAKILSMELNTLIDSFRSCFAEQILGIIDNRHGNWEAAAKAEARQWRDWHWTQYDAWCRNNGHHSTQKRVNVDWNAQIVWKMRTELDFQWDIVEEEVDAVFNELLAAVEEQFNGLKTAISTTTTPSAWGTQLIAGIDPRIQDCRYKLTRAQEDFARNVTLLRRYICEPSHSSYILDSMIPTYRAASTQFGTDKKKRQRDIVEGRITDEALFPGSAIALQQRMDALLLKTKEALGMLFAQITHDVKRDINFLFASRTERQQDNIGPGSDGEKLQDILGTVKKLKARAEEVRSAAGE